MREAPRAEVEREVRESVELPLRPAHLLPVHVHGSGGHVLPQEALRLRLGYPLPPLHAARVPVAYRPHASAVLVSLQLAALEALDSLDELVRGLVICPCRHNPNHYPFCS